MRPTISGRAGSPASNSNATSAPIAPKSSGARLRAGIAASRGLPAKTTSGASPSKPTSTPITTPSIRSQCTRHVHRRARQFWLIFEPFIVISPEAFTLILPEP